MKRPTVSMIDHRDVEAMLEELTGRWRLTVKCQDDAGAQMSPDAVGCQP